MPKMQPKVSKQLKEQQQKQFSPGVPLHPPSEFRFIFVNPQPPLAPRVQPPKPSSQHRMSQPSVRIQSTVPLQQPFREPQPIPQLRPTQPILLLPPTQPISLLPPTQSIPLQSSTQPSVRLSPTQTSSSLQPPSRLFSSPKGSLLPSIVSQLKSTKYVAETAFSSLDLQAEQDSLEVRHQYLRTSLEAIQKSACSLGKIVDNLTREAQELRQSSMRTTEELTAWINKHLPKPIKVDQMNQFHFDDKVGGATDRDGRGKDWTLTFSTAVNTNLSTRTTKTTDNNSIDGSRKRQKRPIEKVMKDANRAQLLLDFVSMQSKRGVEVDKNTLFKARELIKSNVPPLSFPPLTLVDSQDQLGKRRKILKDDG